ncbi:MAG: hypothetical protein P1S60_14015, partial [Anaerolineae bacterium]|nr:hypothetical protein [Anaerolineae bacterium]
QWVSASGSVLGNFDDIVFRYPGWQTRPALLYNTLFNRLFTLWEDGRNGVEYDIYGRFSQVDTSPPVARFTVDDSRGLAGDIFTLNAWPSYDADTPRLFLAARWDFNSDGIWETNFSYQKYITRTIHNPGVYTVTLEILNQAWLTDTTSHVVVAYPTAASTYSSMALQATQQPTASLTISPAIAMAGTPVLLDVTGSLGYQNRWVSWDWENDGTYDTSFSTTLTATHIYTQAGRMVVRADIIDDNGLTNAALGWLTVLPGTPVTLDISPVDSRVTPNQVIHYQARGWDTYLNRLYHIAAIWSLGNVDAGSIHPSTGVFTASLNAGTYLDGIQAVNGAASDSATVEVFWPQSIALPVVLRY